MVTKGDIIVRVGRCWSGSDIVNGKWCTQFPFKNGTAVVIEVWGIGVIGEFVDGVNDVVRHGEFSEVVAVDALARVNVKEVESTSIVGGVETNGADTAFFVGVIGASVHLVISAESSFEIVAIDFTATKYDAGRAQGPRYAVLLWKVIKTRDHHCKTFVNHDFGCFFKRQWDPEASGTFLDGADSTFDTGNVLSCSANLNMGTDFVGKFGEFVVGVDEGDVETTIFEKGEDFFDTFDDI